jgi:hypothetical protein
MVSALKSLPPSVSDLRSLLMFLSSRNYVKSPMMIALSLFNNYQLTPREYDKDSYVGYVYRMAEVFMRAPIEPADLSLAPYVPLLLPELESSFKLKFVMILSAHKTSAPLPRNI